MKRITAIALTLLLVFSMSVSVFAEEATLDKDNTQTTIDIYAKYESGTEGIYSANLSNGSATVTADGVSISISGAPDTAKTVEVFPIPASDSEALDWMGGRVSERGTLSHAYIISIIDASGNKTSANGVSVTISCSHCNGDEIVIGLNTDGTATPIETASGSFNANGNAYYIVAEKSQPSGITVPVRGDENEIHADATLDGKTVELHDLDFDEIDHIVGDHVNTGIVEIDLTGLDNEITVIELPMASIKHIVEAAEEAHNDTEALQIDFPNGSVKLDDKTLRAIIDTVGEETTVDLVLESVGTDRLNDEQKTAIEGWNILGGVEAYLLCNTTSIRVSDFKGGTATMYVPFTLPEGVGADEISVWHIADDGTKEKMNSTYDDGVLSWEVGHFSNFIIASEKAATPGADPNGSGDLVPEPQIDNDGFPWWTIPVGVVTLGGGGFAIYWFVIKKKTWADLIAVFKK